MVKKCSVGGCKSNYESQRHVQPKHIPVYSFPKDVEQRKKWLDSLPNLIQPERVTDNIGVCALHFAPEVPMVRRGSRMVPNAPPTIFPIVPSSCIPASPSQPRPTKESSSDARARTMDVDEMDALMAFDRFGSQSDFVSNLSRRFDDVFVATSNDESSFIMLSIARDGPVHAFSLYGSININSETGTVTSLSCEAFQYIKLIKHPTLKQQSISCWSQLEELVCFLRVKDECELTSDKFGFLLRQIQLVNAITNNPI